jgi:hypothetical protein
LTGLHVSYPEVLGENTSGELSHDVVPPPIEETQLDTAELPGETGFDMTSMTEFGFDMTSIMELGFDMASMMEPGFDMASMVEPGSNAPSTSDKRLQQDEAGDVGVNEIVNRAQSPLGPSTSTVSTAAS